MALTATQIRTKVDNFLADLWMNVLARELAYAANHDGRFWQGLVTHTVTPSGGDNVAPDQLTAYPTDQPEDWATFAGVDMPATLPCALVIDTYDGPQGKGFVATVMVIISGKVYQRAKCYGDETWRTFAWRLAA